MELVEAEDDADGGDGVDGEGGADDGATSAGRSAPSDRTSWAAEGAFLQSY